MALNRIGEGSSTLLAACTEAVHQISASQRPELKRGIMGAHSSRALSRGYSIKGLCHQGAADGKIRVGTRLSFCTTGAQAGESVGGAGLPPGWPGSRCSSPTPGTRSGRILVECPGCRHPAAGGGQLGATAIGKQLIEGDFSPLWAAIRARTPRTSTVFFAAVHQEAAHGRQPAGP